MTLGGRHQLAAATPDRRPPACASRWSTDEDRVIAPARRRLLWQLGGDRLPPARRRSCSSRCSSAASTAPSCGSSRAPREQERMAALGTAASLIAHEVKNSLNGLKAAAAMQDADGARRLATRTIRGQTDRLAHLATSLLHFGKPARAARGAQPGSTSWPARPSTACACCRSSTRCGSTAELAEPVRVTCDPLLVVDGARQPDPQRDRGRRRRQGPRARRRSPPCGDGRPVRRRTRT